MKGKKNKKKRYFCDWFWTHIICWEKVNVGGEWIYTSKAKMNEIKKWKRFIGINSTGFLIIISIILCLMHWLRNDLIQETDNLESIESKVSSNFWQVILLAVLIGLLASALLYFLGFCIMSELSDISEKRKYKIIKQNNIEDIPFKLYPAKQMEYKEYRKQRKKYLKTKRRGKRS